MDDYKTLVIYVFHEYNLRVEYFFKNSLFYDNNTKFLIICNTLDLLYLQKMKELIPSYVDILFRDNKGFDFGAWSEGIYKNKNYDNYDYFIFVNSSVIGPFLPDSQKEKKWTDIFISGLTDNIKLFGSSISSGEFPSHVQSYLFCMNAFTLKYLMDHEIFTLNKYTNSKTETIHDKEINMSQLILKIPNWNIGSKMEYYKNIDFSKNRNEIPIFFFGDTMNIEYMKPSKLDKNLPFSFKNTMNTIGLWSIEELIFIKGNRIIE